MSRAVIAWIAALAAVLVAPGVASAGSIYIAETSSTGAGMPASAVRLGSTEGAALSTFATVTGATTRVQATESRIAWNQGSRSSATPTLFIGNRDGSGTPAAHTFGATEQVAGIAIDGSAGRVYAIVAPSGCTSAPCSTSSRVISVALDGSGSPTTLFDRGTGALSLPGIAVDPAGGKLYWCEFDSAVTGTAGSIMMGNLDGSGTPTAIYTSEYGCNGIAVDHAGNRLFWARYRTAGPTNTSSSADKVSLIRVGSLTGATAAQTLFSEAPMSSSSGMAYDSGAGKLYWANFPESGVAGAGSIRSGSADGSGTASDLYTGLTNPNDVSLVGTGTPAAAPAPAPAPVAPTATVSVPSSLAISPGGTVTVTCSSEQESALSSCTVTLTASRSLLDPPASGIVVRAAKTVVIGRATKRATAGAKSLKVSVELNATGRRIVRSNLTVPITVGVKVTSLQNLTSESSARSQLSAGEHLISPEGGIFDSNSVSLNKAGVAFVNRLAKLLPSKPKNMVFIGFADNTGVPGDNRWLGDRRAKAVRDALAAKGVEPVKSSIETKAARSPRDDNAKASGRERNRRVSIRITY